MRFLSNTHDPKDPNAKRYIALSFEDMHDPQGRERAWRYHLEWLKGKTIGQPQATEAYTVEQLEAMGLVGVYAPD